VDSRLLEDSQLLIRLGDLAPEAGILRCPLLFTLGGSPADVVYCASVELRVMQGEFTGSVDHADAVRESSAC
jgi:hypothetical protein